MSNVQNNDPVDKNKNNEQYNEMAVRAVTKLQAFVRGEKARRETFKDYGFKSRVFIG